MGKRGYYPPMSAACVSASSNLGTLIPPSLSAIIYGVMMEISVGKQIMAGLLPGLLTAALYIVMIMTRASINPALGPPAKVPWSDAFKSLRKAWGVAIIFGIVVGGIYTGFFTPTEASAVGCIVALILCIMRNGFRWEPIKIALTESVHIIGMIFFLLLGAGVLKLFFATSGLSYTMSVFFLGLELPVWALTLLLLVPYLILGMFIDTITIIVLTLPVYYLILVTAGVDLMVFGVLVCKLTAIAMLTPPLGFNILLMHGIAPEIPLGATFREALWFILIDMIIVVILIFSPAIVTFLPSFM